MKILFIQKFIIELEYFILSKHYFRIFRYKYKTKKKLNKSVSRHFSKQKTKLFKPFYKMMY